MHFSLPYGTGFLSADIPDERISAVLKSRLDDYAPGDSPSALVRHSMEHPLGTPRLSELARDKKNIVLIASDHTRPVPSRVIVPLMLEEIRRGSPDASVTILIATGCHRATTDKELREKFGDAIVDSETIVIHDSRDQSSVVSAGVLPSGGAYKINRLALEADLLVAEGFIEPHFFAGFSGGRKSVLPGVASIDSVTYNHNAAFIGDKYARAGELDRNPIHRDMIYAAKQANLAYIVNVVINSKKEVVASFAGHFDDAHRAGCDFLVGLVAETPVFSDIVITTNNGSPLDQNIYQAVKGMCTAESTCKEGGVIISAAKCDDGHGGEVFFKTFLNDKTPQQLLTEFLARPAYETIEDQWESQILARILSKHSVILISEAPDEMVRNMRMIPAASIEQAVETADQILKKQGASICVIPEGITTMIRAEDGSEKE